MLKYSGVWFVSTYMCVQEIKFEPNVMCEHIDKKSTFKASQVSTVII